MNIIRWVRVFQWAKRCAEENPGIWWTASIDDWRLTYRIAPDGYAVVRMYQIVVEVKP
jgi:hypothetical protein